MAPSQSYRAITLILLAVVALEGTLIRSQFKTLTYNLQQIDCHHACETANDRGRSI